MLGPLNTARRKFWVRTSCKCFPTYFIPFQQPDRSFHHTAQAHVFTSEEKKHPPGSETTDLSASHRTSENWAAVRRKQANVPPFSDASVQNLISSSISITPLEGLKRGHTKKHPDSSSRTNNRTRPRQCALLTSQPTTVICHRELTSPDWTSRVSGPSRS